MEDKTMERVFVKKYAEFLTAYSDGKTIQCAIGDTGDWYDIEIEQIFDYVYPQLRIKPETKRVPLTMQDLIDRIKEGKTMWIALTDGGICQQITSFSWEYFTTNVGTYNYDQLAEKFTFLDGTPCYKEVEDVV